MDVADVGLVHCDPCGCKVKGFRAISSIERNVAKRHLKECDKDGIGTGVGLSSNWV